MLTTKQITGLLYSMGHTFDNLASTYIATEEFLTTKDTPSPHAHNAHDEPAAKTRRSTQKDAPHQQVGGILLPGATGR